MRKVKQVQPARFKRKLIKINNKGILAIFNPRYEPLNRYDRHNYDIHGDVTRNF